MTDSESDEEMLMVVDLQGIIESDWTSHIGDKCKLVGLDTEEPVLQLDHYIFRGQYKDATGTIAMFEEQEVEEDDEDSDVDIYSGERQSHQYTYRYCTHKRLRMQRAFLTERETKEGKSSTADECCDQDQHSPQADVSHGQSSQLGDSVSLGQSSSQAGSTSHDQSSPQANIISQCQGSSQADIISQGQGSSHMDSISQSQSLSQSDTTSPGKGSLSSRLVTDMETSVESNSNMQDDNCGSASVVSDISPSKQPQTQQEPVVSCDKSIGGIGKT